jgi:hypothetical protein
VNKRIIQAAVVAASLSLVPGLVAAEGSWWQKGADLLNSLAGKQSVSDLSAGEVAKAFRQALNIGTRNVVQQLGTRNGFYADPQVHIPLPEKLQRVKSALDTVGMGSMTDELELKLNRAAEAATPKAKKLFVNAIASMTFDDVMNIYNGPDDAATRYFQRKMTPGLSAEMRPIVRNSMAQVGAIRAYDHAIARYRDLPFVPDVKADLTQYVVNKALQGIFHYVAKEEAAIRKDPARQTTALLKRVFGAK